MRHHGSTSIINRFCADVAFVWSIRHRLRAAICITGPSSCHLWSPPEFNINYKLYWNSYSIVYGVILRLIGLHLEDVFILRTAKKYAPRPSPASSKWPWLALLWTTLKIRFPSRLGTVGQSTIAPPRRYLRETPRYSFEGKCAFCSLKPSPYDMISCWTFKGLLRSRAE